MRPDAVPVAANDHLYVPPLAAGEPGGTESQTGDLTQRRHREDGSSNQADAASPIPAPAASGPVPDGTKSKTQLRELWRGNCTYREPQDEKCPRCLVRRRTGWLWLRRKIRGGVA